LLDLPTAACFWFVGDIQVNLASSTRNDVFGNLSLMSERGIGIAQRKWHGYCSKVNISF